MEYNEIYEELQKKLEAQNTDPNNPIFNIDQPIFKLTVEDALHVIVQMYGEKLLSQPTYKINDYLDTLEKATEYINWIEPLEDTLTLDIEED